MGIAQLARLCSHSRFAPAGKCHRPTQGVGVGRRACFHLQPLVRTCASHSVHTPPACRGTYLHQQARTIACFLATCLPATCLPRYLPTPLPAYLQAEANGLVALPVRRLDAKSAVEQLGEQVLLKALHRCVWSTHGCWRAVAGAPATAGSSYGAVKQLGLVSGRSSRPFGTIGGVQDTAPHVVALAGAR